MPLEKIDGIFQQYNEHRKGGGAGKRSAPYTSNKISRLRLGTEGGFSYALISRERVITISLFQRRSIRQFFDDSGQEFRVIAPLCSTFEVPLKT